MNIAGAVPTDAATPSDKSRDFLISVTLRADPLTSIMLVMVTFISTLVAIYAAGYMHGDRSYWRFFCYIAVFVFSMTMLVSVSNFVLLYVFWEAVGLCSYLLIGFWYQKPAAAAAGKEGSFLVTQNWRLRLCAGPVPDLDDLRHARFPRYATSPPPANDSTRRHPADVANRGRAGPNAAGNAGSHGATSAAWSARPFACCFSA